MTLLLFGFPAAAYSVVSLWRELEQMVKRCGDCAHCKAKKDEEIRARREISARATRTCVNGHGPLPRSTNKCAVCGWE